MAYETAAIVRLYGEIDRKVNAHPGVRADVGLFLKPYHRNPALHWYDDYLEWLGGTAAEAENAFPGVKPALAHLAGNTEKVETRQLERRMFAIAALVRAFPEMKDHTNELAQFATLAVKAPGQSQDQAEFLYAHLAGIRPIHIEGAAVVPGTQEWWDGIVALPAAEPTGKRFKPCAGRWVRVQGLEGPVDAVRTEHKLEQEGIGLEQAADFLNPENWPKCSDFWREMKPVEGLATGQSRYLEVVGASSDEDPPPDFLPEFRAEAELLFNFMWILGPDGNKVAAVTNYRLVPDPRYKDAKIVLDEGTLVVAQDAEDASKLLVTTTKRVRFSREFVPGAIAVMACAFGYGDFSNRMLERALGEAGGADFASFPGRDVTAARAAAAAQTRPRGGGAGGGAAGGFVQEGADIAIRAIREWADLLENVGGAGLQQRAPRRRRRQGG